MSNQKIPQAANLINQATVKKFVVNKFFDENVLQKQYYPYQFDAWKNQQKYGLIDNKNRALFPKTVVLGNYVGENGAIQTNLVFVKDAFIEMRNYHLSLLSNNKLDKSGSIYTNLNPVLSTAELDPLYIKHANQIFDIFYSNYKSSPTTEKITDINSFLKKFFIFLKISSQYTPLTRSEFIKSKVCPSEINGLTISFKDSRDWDRTEVKANNYISDPNFDTFLESARRFGFFVDKNAPWRIIADLQSPVMADYYKKYNLLNIDDVFNKFYHVAHYSDLDVLLNVIVSFWNNFVARNPVVENVRNIPNCKRLFDDTSILKQISVDSFKQFFSTAWALRFYLYCKILENKVKIQQNKFENIYQEALKLNKYISNDAAVDYIASTIEELKPAKTPDNELLTTPDELARIIVQQQQTLPVEGINF